MLEIFKKKSENENVNVQPSYLSSICKFGQNCWLKFINEITKKTLDRKVSIEDSDKELLQDIIYWTHLSNNDHLRVNVAAYMYLELSDKLSKLEKLIKSNNQSSKSKKKCENRNKLVKKN